MVMIVHTAAVRNPAAVLLSETEPCGRAESGAVYPAGHAGRYAGRAGQ